MIIVYISETHDTQRQEDYLKGQINMKHIYTLFLFKWYSKINHIYCLEIQVLCAICKSNSSTHLAGKCAPLCYNLKMISIFIIPTFFIYSYIIKLYPPQKKPHIMGLIKVYI